MAEKLHGRQRGVEGTALPHPHLAPWRSWSREELGTWEMVDSFSAPSSRKASWETPTADAGQARGADLGPGLQGLQTRVWQDRSRSCSPGHWPEDGCGLGLSQDREGAPGAAGTVSPHLSPLLLPEDRNPPPSQACGSEPSGWTGWPHMCAVSPQPRESPPTPRRLAQWVLITHTEIPRTVCSPSSFPHEPWKLDFP